MENKIKKYLSKCDKDTLIELYLQMRFERDLYADMYESMRVNEQPTVYDVEKECEVE